jgi:hypothetical protein
MSNLKMLPGFVAVKRLDRQERQNLDGFIVTPEESMNVGVVRFAAEDASELLGKKILFGSKREEVRVLGGDYILMEKSNVFAEVSEEEATPLAQASESR